MRDHFFDTVDMAAQQEDNRTPIARLDVCEDGETVNLTVSVAVPELGPNALAESTICLSAADAHGLARVLDMLAAGL